MKKILFLMELWIKSFLRLLFSAISGGDECLVCGKRTFLYPLCKACIKTHLSIGENKGKFFEKRCRSCGKTLICEEGICTVCREEPLIKSIDNMLPLFSYRLWNKQLMFLWKTQEVRSISVLFARLLSQVFALIGAEYIVPVPPRKGKIQEKGWDQIDEICNLLKYRYGYKILRLLERKTRIQQKKLDREGRLQQIGKAYSAVSSKLFQKQLEPYGGTIPHTVVLLDDVCTTGSTLESCARILKEAGIQNVKAVTLFCVD